MKALKTLLLVTLVLFGTYACTDATPESEGGQEPTPSRLWMPVFLSDGMVVQQNASAAFWGTTNPNATVTVEASWAEEGVTTKANAGGEWKVEIPTPAATFEPQCVMISDSHDGVKQIEDVLIGEVWHFAGQSNMEMPMKGNGSEAAGNYQPVTGAFEEIANCYSEFSHFRYFKVGRQSSKTPLKDAPNSKWWRVSNSLEALEYSAIAFFCGRKLATELNVPIGIIGTCYGGSRIEAWMPASRLNAFDPDDYKGVSDLTEDTAVKNAPGVLYNAMINPVMPYVVRGWAWYQGESNRDTSHSYARLQQAMVDEWRKAKGDTKAQMPFYYMQISGIGGRSDEYGANLIQAQWDALKLIPNSHIITTSDVGDEECIHYPNKKVPGERLANSILHNTYGRDDIKIAPPQVRSVSYNGNKVVLSFVNGEGLHSTQASIPYVQLLDSSGKLQTATATIKSDGTMEISSSKVTNPQGVRYCYISWHISTVFNSAGIPLAPYKHNK